MENNSQQASWPWRSMFWCGDFGGPAGKHYRRRAWSALLVLAAGTAAFVAAHRYGYLGDSAIRWGLGILAALVFGYIHTQFYRYLGEIDELARRIQLEAVLFAYSAVGIAAVTLGAMDWRINPLWFFLAEPLRGIALALVARRYR